VRLRAELRQGADCGEGPEVARPVIVHLSDAEIERLAQRLSNALRLAASPVLPASPMMSAAEVAEWWDIGRRWVYDHADELGARRLGSGCRPRLRFDPDAVGKCLQEELRGSLGGRDTRRTSPMRCDFGADSLPRRSRAIVVGQPRKRPGRRVNAPRPGADVTGAMKRLSPWSPPVAPAARLPEGQEADDGE
jgi:hypothetical protein